MSVGHFFQKGKLKPYKRAFKRFVLSLSHNSFHTVSYMYAVFFEASKERRNVPAVGAEGGSHRHRNRASKDTDKT